MPDPGRQPGKKGRSHGVGLPPVKGFLETSFVDWPGMIASVLFLPGCNFSCPYCHNHMLVTDSDSLETFELDLVLDRLRPFVGWIDGVVVSGGEPTLHPGLAGLLAAVKAEGFKVKLDTNGHRPGVIKDLARRGLLDMVSMDLKAPLEPLAYRRAAGRPVDLERVRASVEFLKTSGLAHEFRTTVWPAWHGEDELKAMAADLDGCQGWTLQALNPQSAWDLAALGSGKAFEPQELAILQRNLADPACVTGR